MNNSFQPVIGLEVHVELATKSKMFCGCSAEHFGIEPNTHTCPVCLALPGALPFPNKKAIEWTIMLGLALNCEINSQSKFDRKNYFYPDLAKGYQISQYDQPIAMHGVLKLKIKNSKSQIDEEKKIRIRRVHLEEDTGKLQHTVLDGEEVVLVDFNRSGVPLVEIVTEPDFRSIEEVDTYLKKIQQIIRYLGISNADMEKGSMRLEPSISISCELTTDHLQLKLPPYRVELKNINSFRFARKALEYEIKRQITAMEKGEKLSQETRGWDDVKSITYAQRGKEEAHDYRYFPEPDIPPMEFTKLQIANAKSQIPELPDMKVTRFMSEYGLSDYDATILCETKELGDYFEQAVLDGKSYNMIPKAIANWLINKKFDWVNSAPSEIVAKIVEQTQTQSIPESDLNAIVTGVLERNKKAVEDLKKGKTNTINFLIGLVLKDHKGIERSLIEKTIYDVLSLAQ